MSGEGAAGDFPSNLGGGVLNASTLAIINSTLSGNSTGGGVLNNGTLAITGKVVCAIQADPHQQRSSPSAQHALASGSEYLQAWDSRGYERHSSQMTPFTGVGFAF